MTVASTRLRYIRAASPEVISATISILPYKVEIKGAPVFDGTKWVVWFILPEEPGIKFNNAEL